MTHASLFSGIGGFDLAAEWMGWNNAFNCEINPFCRKVLAYHFPNAKQYEDVKAVDFTIYRGHVDVLTGGFPCQPFSLAGKRRGTEDNRYLWGEMLRAIKEIEPRWVVGENVLGIVSWSDGMVFEQVQSDLEDAGYEVQPYIIPACAVDAPHRRDRVWFVAHRRDAGVEGLQRERTIGVCESSILADTPCDGRGGERVKPRCAEHRDELLPNEPQRSKVWSEFVGCAGERVITHTDGDRGVTPKENYRLKSQRGTDDGVTQEWRESPEWDSRLSDVARVDADRTCAGQPSRSPRPRKGEAGRGDSRDFWRWDFSKFPTQSPICGGDDGFPDRLDACPVPEWLKVNKRWRFSSWWRKESIKAYGNAVVPQIPYLIYKTIEEYEEG